MAQVAWAQGRSTIELKVSPTNGSEPGGRGRSTIELKEPLDHKALDHRTTGKIYYRIESKVFVQVQIYDMNSFEDLL